MEYLVVNAWPRFEAYPPSRPVKSCQSLKAERSTIDCMKGLKTTAVSAVNALVRNWFSSVFNVITQQQLSVKLEQWHRLRLGKLPRPRDAQVAQSSLITLGIHLEIFKSAKICFDIVYDCRKPTSSRRNTPNSDTRLHFLRMRRCAR